MLKNPRVTATLLSLPQSPGVQAVALLRLLAVAVSVSERRRQCFKLSESLE